jgi:hypothetical protein
MFAYYVHAANGHDGTAAAVHLLPKQPGWGQRFQSALTNNDHRGRFVDHLQAMGLKS